LKPVIRKLRRFLELDWSHRRLLAEALWRLWAVRIALWVLPFRGMPRAPRPASRSGPDPRRLTWAITAASALVPRATCLVRALATQRLLAAHGHASRLQIGVAKSTDFQAHAWLEHCGIPILGNTGLETYTRLPLSPAGHDLQSTSLT
jgi:hypothetical protein